MNGNEQLLETLARSEVFRNYERAYSEATGMPVALRRVESWQLPLHGRRRENPFCALLAKTSRTCAACLQSQETLAQSSMDAPGTIQCAYGLREVAVPVKLGTETIGFLQTGQVMCQKPTEAGFQRAVEKAKELGADINHAEARAAYLATPVVPQKKLDSVTGLLCIFADHLSMKSNQLAVQAAHAESPVIARARQFIEEHHRDELSLSQVAQAVHTSRFYFCKLFKKCTGIHFTEYVARVRTEKAKNLMLNPNLRVSEIAYEVGFQSLTHFNRVFRKLVGQSPTEYRRRLPHAA